MKTIIIAIVFLGLYGGSLVFKNKEIQEKKAAYIPTTYDLQKKNGIPVTTDVVQKGKFQQFITISGIIQNGQLNSSVAPFVMNKIRTGRTAILELPDMSEKVLGRVSSVSGAPNYLTGLYEVTVSFNKALPKNLGAVTVDIPVKEISDVLLVPREAVSVREERPAVFVLENNKLNKKYVEIAGSNSDVFWIKSGISQDEIVLTSDTRYFAGGEFVKVMNERRKNL